jgi:hypothetical protein
LKKHEPWFEEGCSRETSQIEMVTRSEPNNGDNLSNVRREDSRLFRNKQRDDLKDKINELATHSKNKKIRDFNRGINETEKSY